MVPYTCDALVGGERAPLCVSQLSWLQFRLCDPLLAPVPPERRSWRDGNFRSGAELRNGADAGDADGEPRVVGPLATASVADRSAGRRKGLRRGAGWLLGPSEQVAVGRGVSAARQPRSATSHRSPCPRAGTTRCGAQTAGIPVLSGGCAPPLKGLLENQLRHPSQQRAHPDSYSDVLGSSVAGCDDRTHGGHVGLTT
jgi:hypothetical protein